MFEKIQRLLEKHHTTVFIWFISAVGLIILFSIAGCNQTKPEGERLQHMFDKCMEDKTITECRVLVELKRAGER